MSDLNKVSESSRQAIMREVLELAHHNRRHDHGRPFAAMVVEGEAVVAQGVNTMHATRDLTAHAELEAIRTACRVRQDPTLAGLTIYASGHPCPMCLAAIVAGGAEAVFYAFDNDDAEPYGLSTAGTYRRLGLVLQPAPLPITRIGVGITAAQLYGDAPWPDKAG